jgi:hypothetical protein
MFKISSTWINVLMDLSDHGLSHNFKVTGRFQMVSQTSKTIWCSAHPFWSVPVDKILKDWKNRWWGEPRKTRVCEHTLLWNFCLLRCGELTPKICPNILGTLCIPGSFPFIDLTSARTQRFTWFSHKEKFLPALVTGSSLWYRAMCFPWSRGFPSQGQKCTYKAMKLSATTTPAGRF